jgi:hypothetical protein
MRKHSPLIASDGFVEEVKYSIQRGCTQRVNIRNCSYLGERMPPHDYADLFFPPHTIFLLAVFLGGHAQEVQPQVHLVTHFIEVHGQVAMLAVEVAEIDVDDGVAIGRGPVGVEKMDEFLRHQRREFERCFHDVFFGLIFQWPAPAIPMPGKSSNQKDVVLVVC